MNSRKTVFAIIIFWALIILFAIINNEVLFGSRTTVYLKTVPVDPRDILMGDYVILNYEVSQLPIGVKEKFNLNDDVYIGLVTDKNRIATTRRHMIQTEIPKNTAIYLKGKIAKCPTTVPFFNSGRCAKFGIENYYVKEGEGRRLEHELSNGALVEVEINKKGRAKIKGFKKN